MTSDPTPEPFAQLASGESGDQPEKSLRESLRATFNQAVEMITELSDKQSAFEAASRLAEDTRAMAEEAFELRPRIATQILEEERLSLAGLAKKIGISKARANQMVQQARNARKEAPPHD